MRPDHAGGLTNPYDSRGPSGPAAAAVRWSVGVTRAVVAGVLGVGASVGLAAAGGAAAHADDSGIGTGADHGVPDAVDASEDAADDRSSAERAVAEVRVRSERSSVEVDPVVVTAAVPESPTGVSLWEPDAVRDRGVVPVPVPEDAAELPRVGADPVSRSAPVPVVLPAPDPVAADELRPARDLPWDDVLPAPELVVADELRPARDLPWDDVLPVPAVSSDDVLPPPEPVVTDELLPAPAVPSDELLPAPDPVPSGELLPAHGSGPARATARTSGVVVERVVGSTTGPVPAPVVLAGGTAGPPVAVRPVTDPPDREEPGAVLPDPGAAGDAELGTSPALHGDADPWSGGTAPTRADRVAVDPIELPVIDGSATWSTSARDLLPLHDPLGLRAPVAVGTVFPTTAVATTAGRGPVAVAAEAPDELPPDLLALDAELPTTTAWTTARVPTTTPDAAGASAPAAVPVSTRDVVQVDFAPDGGDSRGTGVVLDPGSVDPTLRIPGADGGASYVLTVKHGLPIDERGEVVGPVRRIAVLSPRGAAEQSARPLPGTVAAVRVSGSSDLALLVVHGDRTGLGPGSRVAAAEPEVETAVGYVGVNPTGETVTGSGRITAGPRNMPLGNNTGTRWGNVLTTSIPSQRQGNSGGPLLDANGDVVGVLAGFDTGFEALVYGGNTYFISTDDLLRFLRDQSDSTLITLPSTAPTRVAVPQP